MTGEPGTSLTAADVRGLELAAAPWEDIADAYLALLTLQRVLRREEPLTGEQRRAIAEDVRADPLKYSRAVATAAGEGEST